MEEDPQNDTNVGQYKQNDELINKTFNLKEGWIKKTNTISEELDDKYFEEVLNILREYLEEYREEAKGKIPSGDVGNAILRILDQIRQLIRSFELVEKQANVIQLMTYSDSKDNLKKHKKSKMKEQERDSLLKSMGKAAIRFVGNEDFNSKEHEHKDISRVSTQIGFVHKEQVQLIFQSIGDLLGVIDEVFPSLLPKPIQKQDISRDSLEVFQSLLKTMLKKDDTKLVESIRDQWDLISSLLNQYNISVVCFEDDITEKEKSSWFEERLVNKNQYPVKKTSSPALVRSGNAICRGVVFVPKDTLSEEY
jgi:hypothetical protein